MQSHEPEMKRTAGRGQRRSSPGFHRRKTTGRSLKEDTHDIRPLADIDWKHNYVYDASLTLGRVFSWVIDNKVEQHHAHLIWTH